MLQNGPWMILEHYLMVQRWHPEFDPSNEEFKKIAIWVRILGLHLEYYNKIFLSCIGKIVGRTSKVNMQT